MAELIGGALLSSLFPVILQRIASRDFKDLFNKKLVKKLEITLNSINQLLDDAETKKYQNQNVKNWLDHLKHEVYEVDQLLDEFDTNVLRKRKVQHFVLAFTNRSESRIKDLLDKLKFLAEQKDVLGLTQRNYTNSEGAVSLQFSERSPTASLVDESCIYGREGEKEEIINFLSYKDNDKQVSIISIVGLGGMGKTTLAQLVYNDRRIQEKFKLKAWVHVSEYFDVIGLTKALLRKFGSAENSEDLDELQRKLQEILTGKNFLLVVDDVWKLNEESWEKLLLPFNHGSSGSKIIVTTRDKKVALIVKSTELVDLEQLKNKDCWSLFERLAFHGRNVCEYPKFESIGKNIVYKCGGLPLAVKTMGNLLRKKFTQREWEKILEADMWRLADDDSNINSVLRLSYHYLPSNLKRCFAYCSIFPKGFKFDRDELIKLWMAEGLLKCCGRDKSEEELGNEFFYDLESISFFQQSLDDHKSIVMHDLVNDLAKSESQEFCLQIEGDSVQDKSERTRHVCCSLDLNDGAGILNHISKIKGLRSLLVVRSYFEMSNNLQRDLFSKLKYLRMLSFCGCKLRELSGEIGNLKLLRYLNLTGSLIERLPDSICKLNKLETLILKKCFKLTKLPSDFYKLVSLRHLNLEGCKIKKMPKQIGSLNHLQTLSDFVVGEENGSNIQKLGNLNRLQGKLCISGLEHVINPKDAAGANLKDKKHVEELYMNYGDKFNNNGRELDVFEALQPNSNLKRLYIKRYKGISFANWISGCHLPNLVSFQLQSCDRIRIIGKEFYGNNSTNVPFRSLEILHFHSMSDWEEWSCLEGFPLLKELSIIKCPKLKSTLPQHLPSLQKLKISDCNKLEELLCLGEFPLLKEISIRSCPELKRALPQHLPSLQKLEISICNKLEELLCLGEFPLLKEIFISNCPELKRALPQHLPSLQKLFINDCNKMEASIPKSDNMIELDIQRCDRILVNELLTSLKKLCLCDNGYTEFSVEQILVNNNILEMLELDFAGCVNCPYLGLCCYDSLGTLSIKGWHSSSLHFSLHLFTKLHYLYLYDCPELESFPMGGLPSNLCDLEIYNCPKLIGSREEWGLFQLNSLIQFSVSDEFEDVESFPEENLLPPTLHTLFLENCSKLRIMNNKGFLHLKSLKTLVISNCPSLESLPEKEALPNSLSELDISNCPIIKEKYEKEGGERWHTISHIRTVIIDEIEQE